MAVQSPCRPRRFLTAAQLEVVRLIAAGQSQDEAAATIGIVTGCVSESLRRARRRTGARSTAHLVALVSAKGLIDPAPVLAAAALAKRHG